MISGYKYLENTYPIEKLADWGNTNGMELEEDAAKGVQLKFSLQGQQWKSPPTDTSALLGYL